jgi:predicted dithiol-disulfide oxidoreductase (DUF899 family)
MSGRRARSSTTFASVTSGRRLGDERTWDTWSESTFGEDWKTYRREGPGMSAFAVEDGVVYHTYSAYERGIDALWGMYAWFDRAPLGRNESWVWYRRHDEYP